MKNYFGRRVDLAKGRISKTGGIDQRSKVRWSVADFEMVEVKTSNFRPLPMPDPYKVIGEWRLCVQRVRPA